MKRAIRTIAVTTCLSGLGAWGAGCELLVQLDRSAVDAGPTVCSICSDVANTPGTGDDASADAASAEAGPDATTADAAVDAAPAESGVETSPSDSAADAGPGDSGADTGSE